MRAVSGRSASRFASLLCLTSLLGLTVALGACGDDDPPTPAGDAGPADASAADAGPPGDAGPRDLGPGDAGPRDMGGRRDLGPRDDAAVPEGCDPMSGIECDGDWLGRCTPECGARASRSPSERSVPRPIQRFSFRSAR